jgi:hypothetical protein
MTVKKIEPEHTLSFGTCLAEAVSTPELIANYDRLRGTNLSFRGSRMDLAIDEACGRQFKELPGFVAFVYDFIWLRLPPEVRREDDISRMLGEIAESVEETV